MFLTKRVKTKKLDATKCQLYRNETDGKIMDYTFVCKVGHHCIFQVKTDRTAIKRAIEFIKQFESSKKA